MTPSIVIYNAKRVVISEHGFGQDRAMTAIHAFYASEAEARANTEGMQRFDPDPDCVGGCMAGVEWLGRNTFCTCGSQE